MTVEGNYTDSHGQSGIGFGVIRLLNVDLLPRIKRINKVRLYRQAAGDPCGYPRLAPAMTRPIRWDLIDANYDQVIKYATAIWDGTASTEAILSRFTRSATHPAYQAMLEIGRAQRTIFAAVADHRVGAVPGLHDVQALFDLPDWAKTGPIGIRPPHGRHGNGARAVIRAVAAASD